MLAVGIDVGGTSIKGAVIKDTGEVLDRFSMPTDKNALPEEVIGQLCDLVNQTLYEHSYEDKVAGIGIGIPGTFNKETGVIINLANLPKWNGFELKKFMESRTHLYVKIVNDADAAALAEAKFGVGKDYNYLLMITLGTGVGGGIVINKNLYNGHLGMGGELGHMVIEMDGELCGCGRKGCFEAYASATALIRQTKFAMESHPDSLLHEEAAKLGIIDARVAFNAEKRGDVAAKEVVENYVKYLSEGLLNYCNILRPQIIVLSGGVANEGENLLGRVRTYMALHNWGMKKMPEVVIKQATLGYDAGKIGA
ncbi:MAG: ROK family protein, partial [Bacilli bacterium]|nr:ROK family protein [Bacilli bacterium]